MVRGRITGKNQRADDYIVLVVDDEPDIRFLLAVTLGAAGYEVVEAGHGVTALELARSARPRLVITDGMMPRMGGVELIRRLRADARTARIPIVLLSETVGAEAGADVVITKPFVPSELIELVGRLTGRLI